MKLSKGNSYNKGCVVDGGLNFQKKHAVYLCTMFGVEMLCH